MAEEKKKATRKKTAAPAKAAPRKKAPKKEIPEVIPPQAAAPKPPETPVEVHKPKKIKPLKVSVPKFYGTGRRKCAVAKVYLFQGSGKITINRRPSEEYVCRRPLLIKNINQPLVLTNNQGKYDAEVEVSGGGIVSQADATRMGIARALVVASPELRPQLRTTDMLKRDPREKERKKYGLKRARRAFQYSKR